VILSTGTTIDASSIVLGDVVHSGVLQPGDAYTLRLTVAIPDTVVGTFNVFVVSDVAAQVFEKGNKTNNTAKSLTTIAVTSAVAPDLVMTYIVAPDSGVPGQQGAVTWTVANIGGGVARTPWTDYIYLTPEDGDLFGAPLLGTVNHQFDLASGDSYTASATITLPPSSDGNKQIVVVADGGHNVYEAGQEANNSAQSNLLYQHPDLVPSQISLVNSNLNSGDAALVSWTTTNTGTGSALGSWSDAIYLSRDGVLGSDDVKLGSFAHVGPLAAGAAYSQQQSVALPLGATGAYQLLVVADDGNTVAELGVAEQNNAAGTNLQVLLSPYADLATTAVTAPQLVADSPAAITVGWTVTNNGTGAGRTGSWTDAVIASKDAILGNGDDIVLGQFAHSGALQVGQSYTTQQRVFFPEGFSARVNVVVVADYADAVFENGNEANNTARADHTMDVMPVPYADLVVTSIVADPTAQSGQNLHVTWTVTNQGIGITDTNVWEDSLTLLGADGNISRDANGNVRKVELPIHFGSLAPGSTYTASTDLLLPNGISGPFRIGVKTADSHFLGAPFEFLYGNNNARVSDLVDVALAPSADLVVTSIVVPPVATESDFIDVAWTVANNGDATASGSWTDTVVLQPINRPQLSNLSVGSFTFDGSLDPKPTPGPSGSCCPRKRKASTAPQW
jgi:hypothetical protein